MNSDGSNITTVFEGPRFGMLFNPSWSRDASTIAFFDFINGIWLLDVDVVGGVPTGTNARLLLDRGAHPVWSPVSDEIAFVDGGTLQIIPATGGDPTVVYTITLPGAVYPAWSPDGTRIAFTEGGAIRVLDLASNEVTTVLGPEWGQQFGIGPQHLDWARTQDVLTFGVGSDASGDLAVYTLELPSGTPTFVVEGKWPTWSPDDQKICFSDGDIIDLNTLEITDIRAGAQWPDWRRF
jgi:Tol biopolymer transport system component